MACITFFDPAPCITEQCISHQQVQIAIQQEEVILIGFQEGYRFFRVLQVDLVDHSIRIIFGALEDRPCAFSNRARPHKHVRTWRASRLVLIKR